MYESSLSSFMISPLRGTGIILLYIDILARKAKAYNSFSFHKKTNHCNIILYINTKNGGIFRHFLYLFFFVQFLDFFRYLLQFLSTVTEDSQRQISSCEAGNSAIYFRIFVKDLPDFFLKFQIDC